MAKIKRNKAYPHPPIEIAIIMIMILTISQHTKAINPIYINCILILKVLFYRCSFCKITKIILAKQKIQQILNNIFLV